MTREWEGRERPVSTTRRHMAQHGKKFTAAEAQGHFDRLIELGVLHLLNQGNRLLDGVLPVLDLRSGCREFLAVFCQLHLHVVQTALRASHAIDD